LAPTLEQALAGAIVAATQAGDFDLVRELRAKIESLPKPASNVIPIRKRGAK